LYNKGRAKERAAPWFLYLKRGFEKREYANNGTQTTDTQVGTKGKFRKEGGGSADTGTKKGVKKEKKENLMSKRTVKGKVGIPRAGDREKKCTAARVLAKKGSGGVKINEGDQKRAGKPESCCGEEVRRGLKRVQRNKGRKWILSNLKKTYTIPEEIRHIGKGGTVKRGTRRAVNICVF